MATAVNEFQFKEICNVNFLLKNDSIRKWGRHITDRVGNSINNRCALTFNSALNIYKVNQQENFLSHHPINLNIYYISTFLFLVVFFSNRTKCMLNQFQIATIQSEIYALFYDHSIYLLKCDLCAFLPLYTN